MHALQTILFIPCDMSHVFPLTCLYDIGRSFVLVLCQTGKLFVFQPSGVLVTSLTAAKARFTSVAASDSHVLLGTRTGHVQLYKSDALTFDRTVPYQQALRRVRACEVGMC